LPILALLLYGQRKDYNTRQTKPLPTPLLKSFMKKQMEQTNCKIVLLCMDRQVVILCKVIVHAKDRSFGFEMCLFGQSQLVVQLPCGPMRVYNDSATALLKLRHLTSIQAAGEHSMNKPQSVFRQWIPIAPPAVEVIIGFNDCAIWHFKPVLKNAARSNAERNKT
jgi:hypothetical protein